MDTVWIGPIFLVLLFGLAVYINRRRMIRWRGGSQPMPGSVNEPHLTSPGPGWWQASDGKWYPPQPENRCLLMAIPSAWKRPPSLSVEVGKDAIWVFDSNSNALITSALPAQVTVTRAIWMYGSWTTPGDGEWRVSRPVTRPILVVGVPGLQPLVIGPPNQLSGRAMQFRFSWRDQVSEERKRVGYLVTDADWVALVEKFGLAPYLEDHQE